jgi:hypothetical protein
MDVAEDVEVAAEAHQRELIQPAAMLFAVQRVFGDKVREQTMRAYGRLIDAHLLTTGVLAAALLRVNGKITPITPTSEERNSLFASFVIGIEACESAIAEGRYLQALALLRQEMETLAQLKHVSAGTRNEKLSPNLAVLENSLGRRGSNAVRHEASNSRIVSLSIGPMRCKPAAVPWIAAERRLRYLPASIFSRSSQAKILKHFSARLICHTPGGDSPRRVKNWMSKNRSSNLVDRLHETNRIGLLEFRPTDLILRSPLLRRLEGWPRVPAVPPSFETRAEEARSSG